MPKTMATTTRELFVNLSITDLPASRAFFAELGFEFDLRFTNETAACMIINEHAYVMLLQRPFFESFTPRTICDTSKSVEGLFAFSTDTREGVDTLVDKAITAGGAEARDPMDHGFMYTRSFFDLDGHQWEVVWMDEAAAAAQSGAPA
jgi:hypothetical protein